MAENERCAGRRLPAVSGQHQLFAADGATVSEKGTHVSKDQGDLDFLCKPALSAPIAAALAEFLANGGSISEAIELVARLEQAIGHVPKHRRSGGQRGSRLSAHWQPSTAEISFALDRGMPRGRVDIEIEKFRNYWIAKSGASAIKRDWSATWRNWIITAMERGNGPTTYGGRGPGALTPTRRPMVGSDAILAGMGRLAHRIDERRMSAVGRGQEISNGADVAVQLDFEPRGTD